MPYCPECGKSVSPNTKFCEHCGTLITSSTSLPMPKKSSRNLIATVIIVALVLGGFASLALYQQHVEEERFMTMFQTSRSAQVAGQWRMIKTFTGSADKDTEDFNVPTSYWRIVYTVVPQNEQSIFAFFVYPSGKTQGFVASVSFVKSGTDTSYIRAGPGGFWIKVLAANLSSWTIEVQIQQ